MLIIFSKTAVTIFLVLGLKLVLNMTFNLSETYFSEKFAIWRYLTSKLSKIAQIEDFGHFLYSASLVFLDFVHNDRWAWCVVFIVFKIFSNFQYSKKLKTLSWISVQEKFLNFIYFQSWQRTDSLFFGKKTHCSAHYSNAESNTVNANFVLIFSFFVQKSKKKDFAFCSVND